MSININPKALIHSKELAEHLITYGKEVLKELESDNKFEVLEAVTKMQSVNNMFGLFYDLRKAWTNHGLCIQDEEFKSEMKKARGKKIPDTANELHPATISDEDEDEDENLDECLEKLISMEKLLKLLKK